MLKIDQLFLLQEICHEKRQHFFRHIDQNISQLISFERDVNMIQDILSLNDEDINNCIVSFFDMYHHLSF